VVIRHSDGSLGDLRNLGVEYRTFIDPEILQVAKAPIRMT